MKLAATILGTLSFMILAGANAHGYGMTGRSQNGATCHSATSNSGVVVRINGIPSTYQPGTSYPLTISVSGGPGAGGGFDLSVSKETLSSSDSHMQILNGEATDSNPNERSWSVSWLAPPTGSGAMTFNVAALSSNVDGTNSGDGWNTNSFTSSEAGGNGGGPTGMGSTEADWFPIAIAIVAVLAVVMVSILVILGRKRGKKEKKGKRRNRARGRKNK